MKLLKEERLLFTLKNWWNLRKAHLGKGNKHLQTAKFLRGFQLLVFEGVFVYFVSWILIDSSWCRISVIVTWIHEILHSQVWTCLRIGIVCALTFVLSFLGIFNCRNGILKMLMPTNKGKMIDCATVDGRNPAPPGMQKTLVNSGIKRQNRLSFNDFVAVPMGRAFLCSCERLTERIYFTSLDFFQVFCFFLPWQKSALNHHFGNIWAIWDFVSFSRHLQQSKSMQIPFFAKSVFLLPLNPAELINSIISVYKLLRLGRQVSCRKTWQELIATKLGLEATWSRTIMWISFQLPS